MLVAFQVIVIQRCSKRERKKTYQPLLPIPGKVIGEHVRPIDVPVGISTPSNFERPVAMLLSKVSTELPFESGELLEAGGGV